MHNNSSSSLRSEKREVSLGRMKRFQSVLVGLKGSQKGIREERAGDRKSANSEVVFLGLQTMPSGKVVPLYSIIKKNHPLYHSTVTEDTLRQHNLQVPQVPRAFNRKLEGSDPLK